MEDKEEKDQELREELKERKRRQIWIIWGVNAVGLATIFIGLITGCSNAMVSGLVISIIIAGMFPMFF